MRFLTISAWGKIFSSALDQRHPMIANKTDDKKTNYDLNRQKDHIRTDENKTIE